jgi:hypothetical protein
VDSNDSSSLVSIGWITVTNQVKSITQISLTQISHFTDVFKQISDNTNKLTDAQIIGYKAHNRFNLNEEVYHSESVSKLRANWKLSCLYTVKCTLTKIC